MKRFSIAVAVLFVVSMLLGFVIHGWILAPDYTALPGLFAAKPDAVARFPWMIAAHALVSIGMVWIYGRGREDRPFLGQGLRLGAALALLLLPVYLMYYATQPIPAVLVVKQLGFDAPVVLLKGVVVA
jgi:hypothetical protein